MLAIPGRSLALHRYPAPCDTALGGIQIAAVLRRDAELVIAAGHPQRVAQRLSYLQRFVIPTVGRVEVAAILRHPAELVIDGC